MVLYTVLAFEAHQPYRIKSNIDLYVSDLEDILDRELDNLVLDRVAENCYKPALRTLRESLLKARELSGSEDYSFAMSMSGTLVEQLETRRPEVLDEIRSLVSLGLLEVMAEPYYHSLSSEIDREEFMYQLEFSRNIIRSKLNFEPVGAVNTELIYRDEIGCWISEKKFRYTIVEGLERVFERDPNYLYSASCNLQILARHYRLSDDIGFRFLDRSWDQYPLTADKFAEWIYRSPGDLVVIYLDFETFGEHFSKESGILDFLAYLPIELSKRGVKMIKPSQAIELFKSRGLVEIRETISWADMSKDLTAWLGNEFQVTAFNLYRELKQRIFRSGDEKIINIWRILGEADHYHYMYYKPGPDFLVHDHFSHHESPRKAFENYVKALIILYGATERKSYLHEVRRGRRRLK